ncbi:MAG TPA: HAD family hydrolase [Chitinophagaceae bacterium]
MKFQIQQAVLSLMIAVILFPSCQDQPATNTPIAETVNTDPLPSWNDGSLKQSIIAYVKDVTDSTGKNFIPVADRIATFDNDGTLWSEQPLYFQLFYSIDQVKAMAPQHPDWNNKQPYKSVLDNNMEELMKQGEKGLLQIVASSHAGMTTDQFESTISRWIDTAKNPVKKKLYKELVFQPMLELVKYLQANDFKVFIVSGGGIEFMRAWAEDVYGIPKDQIIGSSIKSKYDYNKGDPRIIKLAELDFFDDKEGKPVAIQKYIGRKPVFAAGNSDGDLQMLQWAASNKYKNFELYVHHTDSTREWAYDRKSHIGQFDKGWDVAVAKKWAIADMKNDWKVIYPFEKN